MTFRLLTLQSRAPSGAYALNSNTFPKWTTFLSVFSVLDCVWTIFFFVTAYSVSLTYTGRLSQTVFWVFERESERTVESAHQKREIRISCNRTIRQWDTPTDFLLVISITYLQSAHARQYSSYALIFLCFNTRCIRGNVTFWMSLPVGPSRQLERYSQRERSDHRWMDKACSWLLPELVSFRSCSEFLGLE